MLHFIKILGAFVRFTFCIVSLLFLAKTHWVLFLERLSFLPFKILTNLIISETHFVKPVRRSRTVRSVIIALSNEIHVRFIQPELFLESHLSVQWTVETVYTILVKSDSKLWWCWRVESTLSLLVFFDKLGHIAGRVIWNEGIVGVFVPIFA